MSARGSAASLLFKVVAAGVGADILGDLGDFVGLGDLHEGLGNIADVIHGTDIPDIHTIAGAHDVASAHEVLSVHEVTGLHGLGGNIHEIANVDVGGVHHIAGETSSVVPPNIVNVTDYHVASVTDVPGQPVDSDLLKGLGYHQPLRPGENAEFGGVYGGMPTDNYGNPPQDIHGNNPYGNVYGTPPKNIQGNPWTGGPK